MDFCKFFELYNLSLVYFTNPKLNLSDFKMIKLKVNLKKKISTLLLEQLQSNDREK